MIETTRDLSGPEPEWFRTRLATSSFAVLATHGAGRRIDLVPCCFALVDVEPSSEGGGQRTEVVTAIDHKPKRTARLARLANVQRDANASLLADHRDPEDWSQLWWIRVSGSARVVDNGPDWVTAIDALVEKYTNYRHRRPEGPVIRLSIERWSGWSAEEPEHV